MADGVVVPRSAIRTGLGAGLLMLGVFAVIFGGALAWGVQPLAGFLIGSAGVIALVVGAILVRNGLLRRIAELGEEGPR